MLSCPVVDGLPRRMILGKLDGARKRARGGKEKELVNCFCFVLFFVLFLFLFSSSLFADGANQRATTLPIPRVVTRTACGHKGSTHLSPVHAYDFFSRCRFSTPTPRQPMVELFVLTSSRFPLRKREENSLLLSLELANSDLVGVCCTH